MMSRQKERQEMRHHIREELNKYYTEGNRYLYHNTPAPILPSVRVVSAADSVQEQHHDVHNAAQPYQTVTTQA